ncbi:hypothetical protein ACWGCW_13125 [Streptomyces sp. NPDC054933]
MDLSTSYDGGRLVLRDGRVALREFAPEEAARISDGEPDGLRWVDGTPGEGTVVAATMAAKASAGRANPPPGGGVALRRPRRV